MKERMAPQSYESSGEIPVNMQPYPPQNGVLKSSVMDAMLIMVFFMCFIGGIVILIGVLLLNNGVSMLYSQEYIGSGNPWAEMLKGIMNMIIGVGLLSGAYFFINHTIEKKEWWQRLK